MADATSAPFRVIDTGLRGGRANIAFDQALMEARKDGKIPNTIRFLHFRPSALIGIHQILSHEVKVDYCRSHGIEIVRRITGGRAVLHRHELTYSVISPIDSDLFPNGPFAVPDSPDLIGRDPQELTNPFYPLIHQFFCVDDNAGGLLTLRNQI